MINIKKYILLFILIFASVTIALELPENIQGVKDYNENAANEFIRDVSFPIAFLAGVLSFISPCILPLIPAYFSFTFKEKRKITKMTWIFFAGFTIIFVIFGLAASFVGSLATLQTSFLSPLILFAGFFLIFFGLLSFFGKGFSSFLHITKKTSNDTLGVFMMGIFFAMGWSACLGPILGGILIVASALNNYIMAAGLLFTYSLGIMLPFFALSVFYDKSRLANSRFITKTVSFRIFGKKIETYLSGIISGILLVFLGLIFIIFQGTGIFNTLDIFKTRDIFNSLQDSIIGSGTAFAAGIIVLIILAVLMFYYKKSKR